MIQRNQDFCRKRRKEKQSRSGKEESGGETHITSRFWDVWKETVSTWGCRGSRVLRKARLQLEQKGKENIQNRGAAQFSARALPGRFVPLSFFWFFIYHWSNWDIILDGQHWLSVIIHSTEFCRKRASLVTDTVHTFALTQSLSWFPYLQQPWR